MSSIDQPQNDSDVQELETAIAQIWELASGFGLDPFPVHFELVPATIMYEFGAYGLPGRFSHWTHGKAYYRMKTSYDYGLSKIYEMVINSNPSYAFLMEANSIVTNKLVAAHVLGHVDFFKNNYYFSKTSRDMLERVSIHADRIRGYEYEHGPLEVEQFLDAVLSIQEHIDPNQHIKESRQAHRDKSKDGQEEKAGERHTSYDDLWGLDKETQDKEAARVAEEKNKPRKFPPQPEKDLLLFFMQYAPELTEWKRDIISIVWQEMLYFVPQMQTKIMNEGWASFWHARIMRELDLSDQDYMEYANLNAGVVSPHKRQLNPYHLGLKMWEDIERRWDNPTEEEQKKQGREPGKGREKIFEVREVENDVSFLRNYLTKEMVEDLDLYVYKKEGDKWVITEKNWEKVRDSLVHSMTNFGSPYIVVEEGDYKRNRELYLKHMHEGVDLDPNYGEKTLQYVYTLWGRSVHLETITGGKRVLYSYDGHKNSKTTL